MPERSHTRTDRRCRELVFRQSDGVSGWLYRDSLEDDVFVRVRDHLGADDFVPNPARQEALSAFHDPFALRRSGVVDAAGRITTQLEV
jgi:hypothetical protein